MASQNNNNTRRYREVRDVFQKLRQKYRADRVIDFIDLNYFISERSIYTVLSEVDNEPVEKPSMIYTIAMSDDFIL